MNCLTVRACWTATLDCASSVALISPLIRLWTSTWCSRNPAVRSNAWALLMSRRSRVARHGCSPQITSRAEVVFWRLRQRRRAWTRRQRGNTCKIDACRAKCDKSIRGERDQIRSRTAGKRFGNYSLSSQARPHLHRRCGFRWRPGRGITGTLGRQHHGQLPSQPLSRRP